MARVSVVVPTYNEADHIGAFLDELRGHLSSEDVEIVVVDDNSPDGTFVRLQELARADARIVPVLRRTERGLATAVLEGMRHAGGEHVIVMDADGQHPPEAVPRLVAAARASGADLVVGSRYVQGGSQAGFPTRRRFISWGARQLALWGLPAVRRFRLTDPMSGFFLVRRDRLPLEQMRPRGYKILLEVLARAPLRRVVEEGYPFRPRQTGASKLRLRTQADYFLHVVGLALRDPTNQRLALFGLVGASGTLVNLALVVLLVDVAGWDRMGVAAWNGQPVLWGLLAAGGVAREASTVWNFAWNDWVTFRRERVHAHAGYLRRMLRFHIVSAWSFLAYLAVLYPLVRVGAPTAGAAFLGILLGTVLNYFGQMRWTYARRRGTPEP